MYQASLDGLGQSAELKNSAEAIKSEPFTAGGRAKYQILTPQLLGNILQFYADVEQKSKFSNRARLIKRLMQNKEDFVVIG